MLFIHQIIAIFFVELGTANAKTNASFVNTPFLAPMAIVSSTSFTTSSLETLKRMGSDLVVKAVVKKENSIVYGVSNFSTGSIEDIEVLNHSQAEQVLDLGSIIRASHTAGGMVLSSMNNVIAFVPDEVG